RPRQDIPKRRQTAQLRKQGQQDRGIRYRQPHATEHTALKAGKHCSSSVLRDTFCNSTPWRSLRIRPASRRILKCCESVDLGIALSLTFRKFEQFCGHSCATMSAYMATRTGSDRAWRI